MGMLIRKPITPPTTLMTARSTRAAHAEGHAPESNGSPNGRMDRVHFGAGAIGGSNMSRILFVTPPYTCWGVQTIGNWPPLHLAYLAGAEVNTVHSTIRRAVRLG